MLTLADVHTLPGSGDGRTGGEIKQEKKNDVQSLHTQWGHRKDDFPCTNLGVFSQTVTTSQQVTASNTQETSRVDVRFSPTLTAHGARHPYLDSTSSFAGTPCCLSITTTTAGACARACERFASLGFNLQTYGRERKCYTIDNETLACFETYCVVCARRQLATATEK